MKDEKKAPELRFKGFTDDWEQCKLGDVANRFDNLRVPVTANLRKNGNTPYYGANGIQDFVDGYTHDGEYILVAEDGANNLKNYPINYVSGRIWVNNHAHVLQAIPDLANTRFLGYEIGRSNIVSLLVGGGRAKLNADALMNMSINLPKMQEQELIAKIFKTIDHAITLHEEKKRQLERLKSALLQKMFANKSGYPAIRFEGFSDEWEQCKLGDVCEPITDSIDTQKYPNEVFAEYSMPAFDASMKPDIVLGSSMNSVRKIITRPCLLVNKLNVRKKRIWYVKKPNTNAVCSAEFIPLYSDTVDLTFLNQVAKSETFTRYLENHSSGSSNSQKRITPRSLMLSKLHIPTTVEQKLIGKIFESLDHTITLYDQKLNLLKRVKQTLLQKMFI